MGNKKQIAKKFSHIITPHLSPSTRFVEPFVGGFNLLPALRHTGEALCSDVHAGVIAMWQAVQGGWVPPTEVSEEEYAAIRVENDPLDPLTAFVAFGCSFGAKEWGGYARTVKPKPINYAAQAVRSIAKKKPYTEGVAFKCCSYTSIRLRSSDVLYLDPPYAGVTGYKTGAFSHSNFYDWCDLCAERCKAVFVSEFTRPDRDNWEEVWSATRISSLEPRKEVKRDVDRLFRIHQT